MWEKILTQAVDILLPLIFMLIVIALKYVITFLSAKTKDIKNETVQKSILAALAEAETVGIDAINYVNQKMVETLKAAASDGKLTKEEAKLAMEQAKEYFLDHISGNAISIISSGVKPIEEWIEEYLEAKLSGIKADANPS